MVGLSKRCVCDYQLILKRGSESLNLIGSISAYIRPNPKLHPSKPCQSHFPSGPVIKTLNAVGAGSINGQGTKIPHALWEKSST